MFKKNTLLFLLLYFHLSLTISCGVWNSEIKIINDDSSNPIVDPEYKPSPISLSNFKTSNITSNGLEVSIDYQGDDNKNAEVIVYYCSIKQEAGCNPQGINGRSTKLVASNDKFTGNIDLTSSPFSPGDLLKYEIIIKDKDGVTISSSSTYGYVIIPFQDGNVKPINQIGYITAKNSSNNADFNDGVTGIFYDSNNNIFLAGDTQSSLGEKNAGGYDIFVAKLNSTGETLDPHFGGGDGIAQLGDITMGNKASGNDYVRAVQIDSDGNIFLAGETSGSLGETNAGSYDAFVVKLNAMGALDTSFGSGDGIVQLGSITAGSGAFDTDYVRAIQIDSHGNILLAGYTEGFLGEPNAGNSKDAFVAKLKPNGTLDTSFGGGDGIAQLGETTLGSIAYSDDYVTSMRIDSDDNIFLAGHTSGSLGEVNAGSYDAFVAKLDPTGILDANFGGGDGIAQLGSSTVVGGGASGWDNVEALQIDSSGNIFLVGCTTGSLGEDNAGECDIFVAKLKPSGILDTSFGGGDGITQLGNVTIGFAASGYENVRSMKIDMSNNIFLAGDTRGSLGETNSGSEDILLAKLNSNGILDTSFGGGDGIAQLGDTTLGSAASNRDFVTSIAINTNDNIFLAGYTYGSLGEANAGSADAFVAKLDSNGALDTGFGGEDGITQFGQNTISNLGSFNDEYIKAMQIDSAGNIFLAGYTYGSLGEANAGGVDAFVTKFNPTGVLDTSFGSGNGIVQLGSSTIGEAASASDYVTSMRIDSAGNIFLAGYTYGSLGETNAGSGDAYVAKLNSTGVLDTGFGGGDGIAQLGSNTVVGGDASGWDNVEALQIDSSGNIFLAGYTSGSLGETNAGGYDAFVVKLDSNGTLDLGFGGGDGIAQLGSSTVIVGDASNYDYVTSLQIDSAGNIFLAGYTSGSLGEANAGRYDAFVAKLNSTGALDLGFGDGDGITQLGSSTVGIAASNKDYITSMQIDSVGNIFLAGYTEGSLGETLAGGIDAFVAKLDSNGALDLGFGGGDGIAQLGITTMPIGASLYDYVRAMKIDSFGNIFLVGETEDCLGELNAGGKDIFIAKLKPSGVLDTNFGESLGITQLGNTTVGKAASGEDYVNSIQIGPAPNYNIYLAGETLGSLGEINGGGRDGYLLILDSNGKLYK